MILSGQVDVPEPQYVETDIGTWVTRAQGAVYATTWRTLAASIPLETMGKSYTGEVQTGWTWILLNQAIQIGGNTGNQEAEYDKITTYHSVTLPGGIELPFGLRQTTMQAYAQVPMSIDVQVAETHLQTQLYRRLEQLIGEDGQVMQVTYSASEVQGQLVVTLEAECLEEIGRTVEFPGEVGHIPPQGEYLER